MFKHTYKPYFEHNSEVDMNINTISEHEHLLNLPLRRIQFPNIFF